MVSKREVDIDKLYVREDILTLSEAARRLTAILGKEETEAGVLKYVLDEQLKLSINLRDGASGLCMGSIDDFGVIPRIRKNIRNNDDDYCILANGVFDFPMIGANRDVVIERLKQLDGYQFEECVHLLPTVMEDTSDGQLFLLLSYYPNKFPDDSASCLKPSSSIGQYGMSNGLPARSEMVVRISALRTLEEKLVVSNPGVLPGDKIEQTTEVKDEAGSTPKPDEAKSTQQLNEQQVDPDPNAFSGPVDSLINNEDSKSVSPALPDLNDVQENPKQLNLPLGKDKKINWILQTEKLNSPQKQKKSKIKPKLLIADRVSNSHLLGQEDEAQPLNILAVQDKLLSTKDIVNDPKKGTKGILNISKSKWYAGLESGEYPEGIQLSKRCVRWRTSVIMALLERIEKGEKK